MYKGMVLLETRVDEMNVVKTTPAKIQKMLNERLQVKFGKDYDFEIWIGEYELNTWMQDRSGSKFMVVITEES